MQSPAQLGQPIAPSVSAPSLGRGEGGEEEELARVFRRVWRTRGWRALQAGRLPRAASPSWWGGPWLFLSPWMAVRPAERSVAGGRCWALCPCCVRPGRAGSSGLAAASGSRREKRVGAEHPGLWPQLRCGPVLPSELWAVMDFFKLIMRKRRFTPRC